MLGKRLAYLIIASITALTVFVTGCALEEKAEEEQDKNDLNEYKVEIKADPEYMLHNKLTGMLVKYQEKAVMKRVRRSFLKLK